MWSFQVKSLKLRDKKAELNVRLEKLNFYLLTLNFIYHDNN
jgi:hypothetical protein